MCDKVAGSQPLLRMSKLYEHPTDQIRKVIFRTKDVRELLSEPRQTSKRNFLQEYS